MNGKGCITAVLFICFLYQSNAAVKNKGLFSNPFECNFKKMVAKPRKNSCFIPTILREAFELHMNLFFSADSFKIATGFFPFYVAGRIVDKDIQSCFYDACWHRNCYQLPSWCNSAAKVSVALPIVALGSLAFLGYTDELRTTGRVFLVGMPFVIFGKDVLKKWQAEH